MRSSITIVGASLSGIRAAETLRAEGFKGKIKLFGEEERTPYDRPPLSKNFLDGEMPFERLSLISEEKILELEIELALGSKATNLDVESQTLEIEGIKESYDGLIIATGARARKLPNSDKIQGVHTLRSIDDSIRIREAFKLSKNLTGP